jgi:hypothetical protein
MAEQSGTVKTYDTLECLAYLPFFGTVRNAPDWPEGDTPSARVSFEGVIAV